MSVQPTQNQSAANKICRETIQVLNGLECLMVPAIMLPEQGSVGDNLMSLGLMWGSLAGSARIVEKFAKSERITSTDVAVAALSASYLAACNYAYFKHR